jgi:hypothetical protein
MYIREFSKFYNNLDPKKIWNIWTDINNWPKWHSDLEYCKLEEDFKVGACFLLKPKGAPAVKIEITEIIDGLSFTDCTRFFGARMYDTHSLEIKENGVVLINKLIVSGWLRWLWVLLVAKNVADSVPSETEALVNYSKNNLTNGG